MATKPPSSSSPRRNSRMRLFLPTDRTGRLPGCSLMATRSRACSIGSPGPKAPARARPPTRHVDQIVDAPVGGDDIAGAVDGDDTVHQAIEDTLEQLHRWRRARL